MHTNQKPIGNMGIAAIMLLSSLTVMVGTDASAASPGGSISSGKLRFLAGYCPCPGRRCYCYFFQKTD